MLLRKTISQKRKCSANVARSVPHFSLEAKRHNGGKLSYNIFSLAVGTVATAIACTVLLPRFCWST